MDDPRWEPGMPVLDRQPVADPGAARAAGAAAADSATMPRRIDRVPETAPTPLQRQYINLSAIALVAGAVAITALETGSTLSSPLVKVCVLIAGPILVLTTGDAVLRIWRSSRAWRPVDPGRATFRLSWVVAGVLGMIVFAAATFAVLLS
jgi:hypothetical protein